MHMTIQCAANSSIELGTRRCACVWCRAALDFPDEVSFSSTAVKTPATQVFLVTNVGSKAASFTLTAEDPFKVAPSQGTLAAGDTLSCSVTFMPQVAGQPCPAPQSLR